MADEEQVFDFGTKKKKNKKEKKEKAEKDEDEGGQEGEVKLQGVSDWTPGPMKPYEDLLERLYKIIEEHNPTIGNKERYILKPPQVVLEAPHLVHSTMVKRVEGSFRRTVAADLHMSQVTYSLMYLRSKLSQCFG
mmetsp:Transcript_8515/g.10270  ORF Transcript_8515/g.10270 Transcript_8515/m.10270 type:complete len:135 (-) Transcript_8515:84-488(-)